MIVSGIWTCLTLFVDLTLCLTHLTLKTLPNTKETQKYFSYYFYQGCVQIQDTLGKILSLSRKEQDSDSFICYSTVCIRDLDSPLIKKAR